MGQQPNVPITPADLPRRSPKPAAPRRWSPNRPGDLAGPAEVPWGGAFGTPGPDAGYAVWLVRSRSLPTVPGETRDDLEAAVVALTIARASRLGRAPVAADVEAAEAALGVGADDPSWRREWTAGIAHSHHGVQRLVAAVDIDGLLSDPGSIRRRLASGDHVLGGRP
jgi:hypothetical protein